MLNKIKPAVMFVLFCFLVSCSAVYRSHGYTPNDESLSKILIGIDTRASIEEALGSPTISDLAENNSMYFISSRWEHYGISQPKPILRQIVAIKFDTSNILANVSRYELSDGKVIVISRRVTAGGANEISFIKQLMGNVGRFDAQDLLGAP